MSLWVKRRHSTAVVPKFVSRTLVTQLAEVDNLIQATVLFAVWKARCECGRAANTRDRAPCGVTPLGYGRADDGCGKA